MNAMSRERSTRRSKDQGRNRIRGGERKTLRIAKTHHHNRLTYSLGFLWEKTKSCVFVETWF